MNVLRKEPGKKPEMINIENKLEALQEAVGGYIETVTFNEFIVICDEDMEEALIGYWKEDAE